MKIVQPEKLRREGLVLRGPVLVLGLRAAPQLARGRPEKNVAFALTNHGRIALGQPLDQLLIGQISDFRDKSAASLLIALIDKRAFCRVRIPMKPAIDSETKPATCSDFIPASIPI